MKNKRWIILISALVVVVLLAYLGLHGRGKSTAQKFETVQPSMGMIRNAVSSTGTVMPQNRLEVQPPIAGRIDEILVQEGDEVRVGQTLANMSSTERAALLDAARPQGQEAMDYWRGVYKATPIISPIHGTVIVRSAEPGQTVSAGATVLVLSDRLIVQAQVDETDIGKVKLKQKAVISLDAYPEIRLESQVDHIAYESKVVNNVTTYEVDILPSRMPPVFRSGMSANVDIITSEKKDILTLPLDAVHQEGDSIYVLLKDKSVGKPIRQTIAVGLADDKAVEIISGIGPEAEVLVEQPDYSALNAAPKSNPFMPKRPGRNNTRGSGNSGRK